MTCTNGVWVKSIILNRGQIENDAQFVPCFSPAILNKMKKIRLIFLNRSQSGSVFLGMNRKCKYVFDFLVEITIWNDLTCILKPFFNNCQCFAFKLNVYESYSFIQR